jgi:hypothetical protein
MVTAVRLGALALGVSCAGLGAFGAYEFRKLEGGVTYLVLAAPLIAVTAAVIPPIAEATWRSGHPLKATLWWLVLVPAGAVVFFSAAERVHVAKAGAQAERDALRGAASRAERQHSPRPKLSWQGRELKPTKPEARSSADLLAGLTSQQRRQRKLTWKPREATFSSLRRRPQRTVLFRRRRGYSQQRSTWSPSWRSGRGSRRGP